MSMLWLGLALIFFLPVLVGGIYVVYDLTKRIGAQSKSSAEKKPR
jgi:hypothetical protein